MEEKTFEWTDRAGVVEIQWHRVRYILAGDATFIGRERAFTTNGGVWAKLQNELLFCPVCGEPWGAIEHDPNPNLVDFPTPTWTARASPCSTHGQLNFLPDIVYDNVDEVLLDEYPWKILVISAVGSGLPNTK